MPLFSELTAECRRRLLLKLNEEKFADGEFLFRQGDEGDKLYIIQSGKVSVHCTVDGADSQIDLLSDGQYFGERALLKREPRMASTKAVGALTCFSLTKARLHAHARRVLLNGVRVTELYAPFRRTRSTSSVFRRR